MFYTAHNINRFNFGAREKWRCVGLIMLDLCSRNVRYLSSFVSFGGICFSIVQ